ncbi:MAG: extracellular solute-binding protein [Lachnospiraceae bacterium]|nr:extracellular solute-binding protein [Lachnospiraceae bacterium]MDY4096799.1 extracellular solute-binding protein [Lachnospiraceae bacterium]
MKNKSALKFAAVGLCASLMLAGCGGGGSKKETSSGSGDSDTVSFKVTTVYFGDKAPTDTRIQEEWIKLCEEKMGKNLDITFEYIHTGDYTEKLQVINAGGELPDILTVYSTTSEVNEKQIVDEYGSKGLYVNLADHLDDMPNYKRYLDLDPSSSKTLFTPEGDLYGAYNLSITPTGSAHGAESTMMVVKNSVLKELNLEIPTTLDEVYETAKAIKDAGISKYPIVQLEEWQNPEDVVFRAYHTAQNRYYDGTEFKYGPISDDYKQALQYLNKLYTEKLISPDYFTYTTDMGMAALESGEACILPSAWEGYPGVWAQERPEEEWVAVPNPTSDAYPTDAWQFEREFTSEYQFNPRYSMVISANSPVVDELVKFLDLQYDEDVISMLNWGIEGETYEVKDSKKSLVIDKAQYAEYGLPASGTMRSGIFPQPQDMDLWRIEISNAAPIYWEGEIVTEKLVAFSSRVMDETNTCPRDGQPYPSLSADESSEYANIMTPVETYAKEQKTKFIKGERSFDEWDQYLEEINKMGDIQAAMELYNSKLD